MVPNREQDYQRHYPGGRHDQGDDLIVSFERRRNLAIRLGHGFRLLVRKIRLPEPCLLAGGTGSVDEAATNQVVRGWAWDIAQAGIGGVPCSCPACTVNASLPGNRWWAADRNERNDLLRFTVSKSNERS